jgi:hypothetical protein
MFQGHRILGALRAGIEDGDRFREIVAFLGRLVPELDGSIFRFENRFFSVPCALLGASRILPFSTLTIIRCQG